MSTLTIRNVPTETKQALRERAARNGRSMEAELRTIIDNVVGAPKQDEPKALSPEAEAALARLQKMFEPKPGEPRRSLVDELIAERRAEAAKE